MSNELELYIHIPFCVKKCSYCDFLSAPASDEVKEAYVNALLHEITLSGHMYGGRKVTSIFMGGGTPSILSTEQIIRIIDALKGAYDLSGLKGKPKTFFRRKAVPPSIEFTIECNPGTVDRDKLKAYKKAGVNRLSLGLQSAVDEELKELGRIHTVQDFLDSYEAARMAGFDNINVDLMQAIPRQTVSGWRKTLMAVAALRPEHISAYSLQIEEGTPFYDRAYGPGKGSAKGSEKLPLLELPGEDEEREIYYVTKMILEQFGYHRYEISNYALEGRECSHNCGYWTRKNYLGLGLGSSSMIDNVRWKNISDLDRYIDLLGNVQAGDGAPAGGEEKTGVHDNALTQLRCEIQEVSHREQMEEYMFLGLRMMQGITKEEFFRTFKVDYDYIYGNVTAGLEDDGLIATEEKEVEDPLTSFTSTRTRVYLTDKGIDVSNKVLAEFLLDETGS